MSSLDGPAHNFCDFGPLDGVRQPNRSARAQNASASLAGRSVAQFRQPQ